MTSAMNNSNTEMDNKKAASLSHFLSDFAPRQIPDTEVEVLPMDAEVPVHDPLPAEEAGQMVDFNHAESEPADHFDEASLVTETKVNAEELRKQAVDEAVEKTKAELEAKFAEEKASLIASHEKELDELKVKTIAEVAANLDNDLKQGFDNILEDISKDVAKVLGGFISEQMHDEALNDFAKRIAKEAISAKQPLVLQGNKDLLKALEARPDFDKTKFVLRPTDAGDIRLELGDQVIATRLEPVMKELKGLVQ
ncbi:MULTISPECIES: hypothetical protein [Bartonella]|uniref:hypothetical protein n=1 Tax=Bartonella TaxID=773 RepID=UPI0018DDE958|nr:MULTISPECIES: hypothetical protein [Bartonella]MBH9974312.1 hypothetical protein [Bartonella choladocola]MBI0013919.1 hypothetical protein [Bartonella sp. B10834G3]